MAEHEGTPEDFARLAASLRGQDIPTKQEQSRTLVESIHPPEPESEPDPEAVEAEGIMARLLAPKPGHAELVRRLHGTEDD